jgi:hypothetical protein
MPSAPNAIAPPRKLRLEMPVSMSPLAASGTGLA